MDESTDKRQLVLRYCVSYAARDAPIVFASLSGTEYADLAIRACLGPGDALIVASMDSNRDPRLGFIFCPDLTFGGQLGESADKMYLRFADNTLPAACAKYAEAVGALHKIGKTLQNAGLAVQIGWCAHVCVWSAEDVPLPRRPVTGRPQSSRPQSSRPQSTVMTAEDHYNAREGGHPARWCAII